MRRHTSGTNNRVLIEQAIATLVNNQAAFVAQLNENNKIRVEAELRFAQDRKEAERRFAQDKKEADLRYAQDKKEADLRYAQDKKEADLRFSRIEKELEEIKTLLQSHDRILTNLLPEILAKLPEAVSRKIGFKPK
jgi:hypothetical protein